MASYRFSAAIVSRGNAQSAIAKAAYNAREDIGDERTGAMKRYADRPGLEWSGIFAPKDAPEWAHDRAKLWNAVERREDRSTRPDTAQLARSIEVSFPHELSLEECRRLLRDYVRAEFVRHGMIVDAAIHAPDADGDQRNRHGHLLITMRSITPEGFGPKVREWNSTEQALRWRETWAALGARYLVKAGHELEAERYRAGHLTLEKQRQAAIERGDVAYAETLDRVPTRHLGPQRAAMERRGVETDIGNAYRDDLTQARDEAADRKALAELERQIAQRRTEIEAAPERQDTAAREAYEQARAEATGGPPDRPEQQRQPQNLFAQIYAALREAYDKAVERTRELSPMFNRNKETMLAPPRPEPKKRVVLRFKPPDPDRDR